MLGKALPSTVVGLIQATIIFLVAQLWFRIPFAGSLITLYSGLILFVIAAVGIGLFVSSLVATMQQAMLFSFVLLMPFILLSGLATPIGNMPEVFQALTLHQPAALRHRHHAAGLSGRRRAGAARRRPVAAGRHRRGDAADRGVDVPQPPDLKQRARPRGRAPVRRKKARATSFGMVGGAAT